MTAMSKSKCNRREFLASAGAASAALALPLPRFAASDEAAQAGAALDRLKAGWLNPPRSFRPHTRWWWPGNAVTKEGISWELEQMHGQGMGGVEIMSSWGWYAQGNIAYLSPEWAEMVRQAIEKAAELDMEVALTFGPGWSFGGFWVPVEDRSKVLAPAWVDVSGPSAFDAELPQYKASAKRVPGLEEPAIEWRAADDGRIVAAVAARLEGAGSGRLLGDSAIDLTGHVENGRLKWQVPAGQWRIMSFRIRYTYQQNQAQNSLPRNWVVDHFNKAAMERYCDYLGNAFFKSFGQHFGKNVDSFFCDSFEIMPMPDTVLWSTDTLENFRRSKGYDLKPYLPAIWFDIGELTPKIRYDVNEFLHQLGLETVFRTFVEAGQSRQVQARIQPHYRFTAELIQGAGATPRPETEVTTARFEPLADPRKATAAGAHFYGREIVSAESYTFIHPERYRTSLEDMKRATDAFLRDGVTQFYNHGYAYTPEKDVAPSRDMPWANRISHWNTWWPYYHHLTAYISRCGYLLRQGAFAGDVLVYTPQATVWCERAVFGAERRVMPYGDLAKTLVANGYDFDPVNDDVFQNRARIEEGHIKVRDLSYRFLVLPKNLAVPLKTLEFIRRFAGQGGIVIALDELPNASVGLDKWKENDAAVRRIVAELFGPDGKGRQFPGGGRAYFFPDYKLETKPLDPQEQPYQPTPPLTPAKAAFIEALRRHLAPDFALEGNRQSDGLTFIHRKIGPLDAYFVTNLQPKASSTAVTFRVSGKRPDRWDPKTGDVAAVYHYRAKAGGTEIPFELAPWESTLIVFTPGNDAVHVTSASLAQITSVSREAVTGLADANGEVSVEAMVNGRARGGKARVSDLIEPLVLAGNWNVSFEGVRFPKRQKQMARLASWTDDPETRYFSGKGTYELDFDLPEDYLREQFELVLDLGAVGDVAEVLLNGRAAGVCWMQPYRLPITGLVRPGRNRLAVAVTNQLINHVDGMKSFPEVPPELVEHYGPTTDIYKQGAAAAKRELDYKPLPASGLLGPVRLIPRRRVSIPLA
jgi:hypothetical protein